MTQVLGVMSGKEVLEVRPLEDIEYQKFVTASTKLFEFAKRQELFRLVDANYKEYKNVLNEYFKIHCENSNIDGSYLEGMVFNINRLVLNFLSSFFPFLDQSRKRLSKGKPEKLQNFDKSCSWCYDNYFSYRFLYKLRNYSQHVGLPIIGLETSSEMMNLNPFEVDHRLKTITLKKDLLKFDKWGTVKEEIPLLPEEIDLDPYIDEMMYCIEKINATLYEKEEFIELLQHTAFLYTLVREASIKGGIPCIFLQIEDINDTDELKIHFSERRRLTIGRFPLNAMELIDLLNLSSNGNPLEL